MRLVVLSDDDYKELLDTLETGEGDTHDLILDYSGRSAAAAFEADNPYKRLIAVIKENTSER